MSGDVVQRAKKETSEAEVGVDGWVRKTPKRPAFINIDLLQTFPFLDLTFYIKVQELHVYFCYGC